MAAHIKRAYLRNYYEALIMHANFNLENYCDAKTYNSSVAGMYFESNYILHQNSDICIKTGNYLPDTDGPEAYRFYRAKVRWCKDMAKGDAHLYGIGVQYLVKSHIVGGPSYSCGLCGENIPYGKIHIIDDFVYLCSGCFKQFEGLSDKMIKKSIEDFIIGNVL